MGATFSRWRSLAVSALAAALFGAAPAGAAPAPAWKITITPGPTNFIPANSTGRERYQVTAVNSGGAPTDGSPITITDELPAGLTLDPSEASGADDQENSVTCVPGPPIVCTDAAAKIQPGQAVGMTIPVDVEAEAPGSVLDSASVSGGGAPSASASDATTISAIPAPFGLQSLDGALTNSDGSADTQAGSHPYALTVRFAVNDIFNSATETLPGSGEPKSVIANLPVGLTVNPNATSVKCTEAQLESDAAPSGEGGCPAAAQVGTIRATAGFFGGISDIQAAEPLYNMVPPAGVPASLGFDAVGAGIYVHLLGGVRSASDYGITSKTDDILQKGMITAVEATLWGSPTDPSHDPQRGACAHVGSPTCPTVERRNVPFITMPSACSGPLRTTLTADSWQQPGAFLPEDAFATHAPEGAPAGVSGCERLAFSPSIAIQPTEPSAPSAESPSGLEVDVRIPQEESVNGLAQSDLEKAVVTLPVGMTVSPSAANGLGACAPAQIALSSEGPAACPDASKIGTVQLTTPLLETPLQGAMYLGQQGNAGAAQGSNPFGSLLAVYLVAEGSGVHIKLAGRVEADPESGQLTVHFEGNPPLAGEPQLPFSDLKVKLFGGSRAALMTPAQCANYTATATLSPWSGQAPVNLSDSFPISAGCGAGFTPTFTAGTTNNQAAGFSPLSVTFARNDGEQRFEKVQVQMPAGVLGVLKSVSQCPEPQAASGGCGIGSLIGHATVAAGPGSTPFWLTGPVYLTGPYAGAPFGLSIVVPAVAGPFNLGDIVVRARIAIDPHTAQITVISDALPQMVNSVTGQHSGIPADLRTMNVTVDRPAFTFNATNCSALNVNATATPVAGLPVALASPYQAANCASLPFKPKFAASTQGKTSKRNGASLDVRVSSGHGQANIGKVRAALPKKLPSRLTTLQKACVDAVFEANPAACPAASAVGMATAATPLLARPLTGPAYLVSHGGAEFPDLEIVLQGEGITLVLDGNTHIKRGITTSTFNSVPDAPIDAFELKLPQGPHSVLGAFGKLCAGTLSMPTTITGQNGAVLQQTTKIAVSGCPKHKKLTKNKKKKKK